MAETRLPIITLTTDFGHRDHYVSSVKAAILAISTRIVIVDVTHDIPAFDVQAAAWAVRVAFPDFPRRTVHVAIVDPGVGTPRRPILVETENHFFIGPDNGIFTYVYEAEPPVRVYTLTSSHYVRSSISATFHGRDLFGPAAAHLARGADPAHFGEEIEDPVRLDHARPESLPDGSVRASVVHIDRFGALVLNVTRQSLASLRGGIAPDSLRVVAAGRRIDRLCRTYGEAAPGEDFLLFNSSDLLEVSQNQGRASDGLGLRVGDSVEISFPA